jgi:hypothetical protein
MNNLTIAFRPGYPIAELVIHGQGFHSITNSVGQLWSPFTTKKRKASSTDAPGFPFHFSVDFSSTVPVMVSDSPEHFNPLISRVPFGPTELSPVCQGQQGDSRSSNSGSGLCTQKATRCKEPNSMDERGDEVVHWPRHKLSLGAKYQIGKFGVPSPDVV